MSHFDIRFLSVDEYKAWDTFVDSSEYGSIFHKTIWINSLRQVENYANFDVIACYNNEGNILGGAILPYKRILSGYKVITTPFATSYSGIIISERNSEYISKKESYRVDLLNALIDFIEKSYDSISIMFPPDFKDVRAMQWRKYKVDVMFTYYGNLAAIEENTFVPAIRRRIKKAMKQDYTIKDLLDENHLDIVFNLLSKSYKRQNHLFKFKRDEFIEFCKSEDLKSNMLVYSIWLKNVPVSAIIVLTDRDKAYYWLAGGDHAYFDSGLNQLLLWKVLEILKSKGINTMDLAGANTPSISKYKSGYNFDLVAYYKVQKDINPGYHFLYNLKRLFK